MGKPLKLEAVPLEGKLKKIRRKRTLTKLFAGLAIIAVLGYLLFGVFFGVSVVRGNAMEPALYDGDLVLYFRLARSYHADDIVLVGKEGKRDRIKRIVAGPGQTVEIKTEPGQLFIDETPAEEPYVFGETLPKTDITYPLSLKENEFFVLGDRRTDSLDSRNYGAVLKKDIDGAVISVIRFGR